MRVTPSCILSPSRKTFAYFFCKEETELGKDVPGEPWPPSPQGSTLLLSQNSLQLARRKFLAVNCHARQPSLKGPRERRRWSWEPRNEDPETPAQKRKGKTWALTVRGTSAARRSPAPQLLGQPRAEPWAGDPENRPCLLERRNVLDVRWRANIPFCRAFPSYSAMPRRFCRAELKSELQLAGGTRETRGSSSELPDFGKIDPQASAPRAPRLGGQGAT